MTRDSIIDGLNFESFRYEEAPLWENGPVRPTDETRQQVRAGAVLKLKDGSTHFVGDCNELLGVCDDCREFDYKDIAEIAHLWVSDEEEKPSSWEESLKSELDKRGMLNQTEGADE